MENEHHLTAGSTPNTGTTRNPTSGSPSSSSIAGCILTIALLLFSPVVPAVDGSVLGSERDWVYVGGAIGEDTDAFKVGVHLGTSLAYTLFGLVADVNLELEVGRWGASRPVGVTASSISHQFSLVPALRFRNTSGSRRYIEVGVGPSWITPRYRNATREFSTRFQFRDHIAVGWVLGPMRNHDISVRVEHFSNAGIASPNPGVDLFGVRYAITF